MSADSLMIVGAVSLIWLMGLLVVRFYLASRFRANLKLIEGKLTNTQRQLEEKVEEQSFHSEFLRQLPRLCEKITGRLTLRQLPGALLEILNRIFEPGLALIVLRRQTMKPDGSVEKGFYVVGRSPKDSSVKHGQRIEVGRGELGFVLEVQRAMSHQDFRGQKVASSHGDTDSPLAGLELDLAAPMVFDEETVGALAVSGSHRRSAAGKEVLRLIAQIAVLAYYDVASFREMKQRGQLDRVTGVLNKDSIAMLLKKEISEAERRGTELSVLVFDIDNFKNYNDLNGPLMGDKLLTTLAWQVEAITRAEDSLGRLGGEEFLLVLPETPASGAMVAAEKVRNYVSRKPFPYAEKQPLGCVSISGGLASFPRDSRDGLQLLQLAEQALDAAKRQGRNRVLAAGSDEVTEEASSA